MIKIILMFILSSTVLAQKNSFFTQATNAFFSIFQNPTTEQFSTAVGISDSPAQFYDPTAIALFSDTATEIEIPFVRVDIRLFILLKKLQPESENFVKDFLFYNDLIVQQSAFLPSEIFCLMLRHFMNYPLLSLIDLYLAYQQKPSPEPSFQVLLACLIRLYQPDFAQNFIDDLEQSNTSHPELLLAKARLFFLQTKFKKAHTTFQLAPEYGYCPARYLSGIMTDTLNKNTQHIDKFSEQLKSMILKTPYPSEYDFFQLFPLLAHKKYAMAQHILADMYKKAQLYPFHLELLKPFLGETPIEKIVTEVAYNSINADQIKNDRQKFYFLTNLFYAADRIRNENTCTNGQKSSNPLLLDKIIPELQLAIKTQNIDKFANICQYYAICNPALRAYPWTNGVQGFIQSIYQSDQDFLQALMPYMEQLSKIFRYRILNDIALIAYFNGVPLEKINFPVLAPKDLLLRSSENILLSKARNLIYQKEYQAAWQIISRLRDQEELPEFHELQLILKLTTDETATKQKLSELKNPQRLKLIFNDYR